MTTRPLALRRERLTELTGDDLAAVAGGEPTVACALWDKISLAITCHTAFCPTENARRD